MGSRFRRFCRPALLSLALAGSIVNAAAQTATSGSGAGAAPATRNAAISALLSNGFSSVTALRKSGDVWVGQGVRHAVLVRFRIDGHGVQAPVPGP